MSHAFSTYIWQEKYVSRRYNFQTLKYLRTKNKNRYWKSYILHRGIEALDFEMFWIHSNFYKFYNESEKCNGLIYTIGRTNSRFTVFKPSDLTFPFESRKFSMTYQEPLEWPCVLIFCSNTRRFYFNFRTMSAISVSCRDIRCHKVSLFNEIWRRPCSRNEVKVEQIRKCPDVKAWMSEGSLERLQRVFDLKMASICANTVMNSSYQEFWCFLLRLPKSRFIGENLEEWIFM